MTDELSQRFLGILGASKLAVYTRNLVEKNRNNRPTRRDYYSLKLAKLFSSFKLFKNGFLDSYTQASAPGQYHAVFHYVGSWKTYALWFVRRYCLTLAFARREFEWEVWGLTNHLPLLCMDVIIIIIIIKNVF